MPIPIEVTTLQDFSDDRLAAVFGKNGAAERMKRRGWQRGDNVLIIETPIGYIIQKITPAKAEDFRKTIKENRQKQAPSSPPAPTPSPAAATTGQ